MPKKKLTEAEWQKVFTLRCRTKSGQGITDEETKLVRRAFREDPERYGAMDEGVFNATVPFGSDVKWKGTKR